MLTMSLNSHSSRQLSLQTCKNTLTKMVGCTQVLLKWKKNSSCLIWLMLKKQNLKIWQIRPRKLQINISRMKKLSSNILQKTQRLQEWKKVKTFINFLKPICSLKLVWTLLKEKRLEQCLLSDKTIKSITNLSNGAMMKRFRRLLVNLKISIS